jgi:hypothetical protein
VNGLQVPAAQGLIVATIHLSDSIRHLPVSQLAEMTHPNRLFMSPLKVSYVALISMAATSTIDQWRGLGATAPTIC